MFLMYTNGTLIDDNVAKQMAAIGNLTPASEGGDLCVDWNGAVMPCVFMPYSPILSELLE